MNQISSYIKDMLNITKKTFKITKRKYTFNNSVQYRKLKYMNNS